MLLTFEFLENFIVDSAQCKLGRSSTPQSVSLRGVQIRAVDFCKIFKKFEIQFHHKDPKFLGNGDFRKSRKFV